MNLKTFLEHFDTIAEAPGGIPKLRSLILDLAVQGKLVPQNLEDESASKLLERLKVERKKLIEEKKIRKSDIVKTANTKELFHEIPRSWEWTRIGSFALVKGGKRLPQGSSFSVHPTDFIYIQVTNMKDGTITQDKLKYIDEETYLKISQYTIEKDDLYISIAGTIGEVGEVPAFFHQMNLTENAAKIVFRGLNKHYFILALQSNVIQDQFKDKTNKQAQPKLALKRIADTVIPIPPKDEQDRIVAKVNELMALCDRYEAAKQTRDNLRQKLRESAIASLMNAETDEELDAAWAFIRDNWHNLSQYPEDVHYLRQTVLELAVRGKLVHQDSSEGEVTELIEVMLSKASFIGNRKNSLLSLGFWEIPENWSWLPLSQFGQILGGGTPSKDNPDFWSGDIPWVSPKDMKLDYIESSQDYISETGLSNSSTKLVPEGSILMVIRGMILAHSFPVAVTRKQVTINQDMKALMLFIPEMSDYLLICLKGLKRVFLNLVERSSHGTCRLPTEQLFSQPIPLPPLAEQKRIVAKVHELMQLCDQLEASLHQSQQWAESLAASAISHLTI